MRNRWRLVGWASAGVLAATVWMAGATGAYAAEAEPYNELFIDGKAVEYEALTIDKTSYVPLDAVSLLGGTAYKNMESDTYTISAGRKEIQFRVGEIVQQGSGSPVTSDKAAVQLDNRIYVPVDWLSGLMSVKLIHDRFTSSVYLFRDQSGSAKTIATSGTTPGMGSSAPSDIPVTVSNALPTLTSIKMNGDELSISLTGEVSPQTFRLKSPDRLVVDLPHVTLEQAENGIATGSVDIDKDHPYISGIRYSLFTVEPTTVRVVIDLKTPKPYIVQPAPNGLGVTVKFLEIQPLKVMIDAGHGGNDPGALSRSGKYEKDVTLAISQKVMDRLRQETMIEPFVIRGDDAYLSPYERAEIANAAGIDLFISIHANTADSPAVKGTETYYWRDDSLDFADTIHQELVQTIGSGDRKVKRERFVVVRETTMPAVLLELGFLTNAEDEAKLFDNEMQNRIAEAIVSAIKKHYYIP